MKNYENVTVIPKANVYFDGKVSSRTLVLPDESKVTLGFMIAGDYEFSTGAKEHMTVLNGSMRICLANDDWQTISVGESFDVAANSSFKVVVDTFADYSCVYID